VLGSDVALSVIGETLNIIMRRRSGLAAVILPDEATVAVETINWHLERGGRAALSDCPNRGSP
jgi:hypothetical protein